ncbi:TPA: NADAR family protein [Vibrio vulnificus]|uniref:NADAR family protein n=1 Tax=Vibrio vulnificus TaxID=672 RepID=A0A8H9MZ59_VIBVL|nr:NADAR family protein [Vibrio vulnificus]HAS8538305.1 NADAR family protein [Vibrio vulnificus]
MYNPIVNRENGIVFTWGESCPFSRYYKAKFELDGIEYPTVAHCLSVAKLNIYHLGDLSSAELVDILEQERELEAIGSTRILGIYDILNAPSGFAAEKLVKRLPSFKMDRWLNQLPELLTKANTSKFEHHPEILELLSSFKGFEFAESEQYCFDTGIGMKSNHPDSKYPWLWRGENLHGKCLQKLALEYSLNISST